MRQRPSLKRLRKNNKTTLRLVAEFTEIFDPAVNGGLWREDGKW
jgi:hypothetical protein